MDSTAVALWVLIAAVIVLVLGCALLLVGRARRNRRTAELRRRFGPEYDTVIRAYGNRRQGEAELRQRLQLRQQVSTRELDEQERKRFQDGWESAQMSFVNTPSTGLREADLLVMQVMRERGYPVENFEERMKLVSVDFPDLVAHFRGAHRVAVANEDDQAGTEDLRQAMVSYQYLFDELLQGGDPERTRRI